MNISYITLFLITIAIITITIILYKAKKIKYLFIFLAYYVLSTMSLGLVTSVIFFYLLYSDISWVFPIIIITIVLSPIVSILGIIYKYRYDCRNTEGIKEDKSSLEC